MLTQAEEIPRKSGAPVSMPVRLFVAIAEIGTGKRGETETRIAGVLAELPDVPRYALTRADCLTRESELGFFTDDGNAMIRNAGEALRELDRSPSTAGRSASTLRAPSLTVST